ncbi:AGAP006174-PA [Anopheles gambiae str. PEST]|uniref:AGAP006174-PA n=1 Tax=Anopheles gambiae TaxID=7165 RepID=Q7Q5W0_ANOGA|nr:AGAP006174-PA [Anopheles gambiae str. PEST]
MADFEYSDINPANELEKRVADAFLIFDHHGNKTVDVREIGTILRFLGCVPTEADVNEVISATEFEDSNGTVHLSKFLPYVSQLIAEHKMEPAPPEKLLKAFRVLDQEGKGFVDKEYMTKLITEEGEPFTVEELEEMMAVAVDMATDKIAYELYLNQLLVRFAPCPPPTSRSIPAVPHFPASTNHPTLSMHLPNSSAIETFADGHFLSSFSISPQVDF